MYVVMDTPNCTISRTEPELEFGNGNSWHADTAASALRDCMGEKL